MAVPGPDGAVYVTDDAAGAVYRMAPPVLTPAVLTPAVLTPAVLTPAVLTPPSGPGDRCLALVWALRPCVGGRS